MTFEREISGHIDRLVVTWIETTWQIEEIWDRTVVRVAYVAHWRKVEALIRGFQLGLDFPPRAN